jgi:hypothetical protein
VGFEHRENLRREFSVHIVRDAGQLGSYSKVHGDALANAVEEHLILDEDADCFFL